MFNRANKESLKKEFEGKIITHMDSLYNTALSMTNSRQDAEDLVQEAALRAYRFYDTFDPDTNFKAWLFTILRNVFINRYRKKVREPLNEPLDEADGFVMFTSASIPQEGRWDEAVKDALSKLTEEHRTVLVLFYLEEFSYREIAQVLNCPEGTVMSRLYGARLSLKRHLSNLMKKGEI